MSFFAGLAVTGFARIMGAGERVQKVVEVPNPQFLG
jgi:hypothetical protein